MDEVFLGVTDDGDIVLMIGDETFEVDLTIDELCGGVLVTAAEEDEDE